MKIHMHHTPLAYPPHQVTISLIPQLTGILGLDRNWLNQQKSAEQAAECGKLIISQAVRSTLQCMGSHLHP